MYSKSEIVRRWMLAGLLAVGAGAVLAFTVGWVASIAGELLSPREERRSVQFDEDGTPLISVSISGLPGGSFRTLDGHEVPGDQRVRLLTGAVLDRPRSTNPWWFEMDWNERILAFSDEARPPTYWYFVHDGRIDGSGCFELYDSATRGLIGYVGLRGFRSAPLPPEECIPVDGRKLQQGQVFGRRYYGNAREPQYGSSARSTWMLSGNRVLEIEFRERVVRHVMTFEDPQQRGALGVLGRPVKPNSPASKDEEGAYRPHVSFWAVRGTDQVTLVHWRTREQRIYRLPPEVRDRSFTFYEVREGEAILVSSSADQPGESHLRLTWLKPDGTVTKEQDVVLRYWSWREPQPVSWILAMAMPSPLAATIAVPGPVAEFFYRSGQEPSLATAYRRAVVDRWRPLALIGALGIAMAWLCVRRQRRYAQSGTIGWAILVFLGGLPGYLGYLWHRRWPVLAPCPHCSREAPRDREVCVHCAQPFPPPELNGTEVFGAEAAGGL